MANNKFEALLSQALQVAVENGKVVQMITTLRDEVSRTEAEFAKTQMVLASRPDMSKAVKGPQPPLEGKPFTHGNALDSDMWGVSGHGIEYWNKSGDEAKEVCEKLNAAFYAGYSTGADAARELRPFTAAMKGDDPVERAMQNLLATVKTFLEHYPDQILINELRAAYWAVPATNVRAEGESEEK